MKNLRNLLALQQQVALKALRRLQSTSQVSGAIVGGNQRQRQQVGARQSTSRASLAATSASQAPQPAVEPASSALVEAEAEEEEKEKEKEEEPKQNESESPESQQRPVEITDRIEPHCFAGRHLGPSQEDVQEMLHLLGYSTLDELIAATVPEQIRLERPLRLPAPLSEHQLVEELQQVASLNTAPEWRSFIGLGYYDCVTPPVIQRNLLENVGWTSAYTAYQAEIAQGRLESLMNFQTMVAELSGLAVANASLLDEPTAAAEALQVCLRQDRLKRDRLLVSARCHPQTRSVVETRAAGLGVPLDHFDELGPLDQVHFERYSGLLLQYPNTSGHLFDLDTITRPAHAAQCLVVAATDLLACCLFKPPGDFAEPADLAVGSAQRLGVPLNLGGPHAGFLSCHQRLVRSIPGRVVGLTRDSAGKPAFRFALQTREQHIRRDKATSNICTAQALLANMSAMYAVYHGPRGLHDIARAVHLKTSLLARLVSEQSRLPDVELLNKGAFFDTLTFRVADREALRARAERAKINLRYFRTDPRLVSISLDETTRLAEVFRLADLLLAKSSSPASGSSGQAERAGDRTTFEGLVPPVDGQLAHLRRRTSFLQHPTFNSHHSEAQLVRYMKQLENKDISLAHSMIPLGSCTMKLNATSQLLPMSWPQFARCHPIQPADQCRGYHKLLAELNDYLCEITGYDQISFQPNSGAQGEYTGLRTIRAYLASIGQQQRDVCLIPISAHGTNPASAQMAGFKIQTIRVLDDGNIDLDHLRAQIERHQDRLACLMITYPSTFGVFEESIRQVCELVHQAGGQVYLDGANMNAQVGLCRPGDYGSDVSHLNLHKTFCIPHGGGGPGAGPIGVKRHLAPFLPSHPLVSEAEGNRSGRRPFGTVSGAAYGSPAILPISWSYIRLMSAELRRSSEVAILNANYMRKRLENDFKILFTGAGGNVAHEFIIDCRPFKRTTKVEAADIAKRLQDFGLHAPTVSWPVSNTLMLEPTESEDRKQLDNYCDALLRIRQEIALIERGHWDCDNNPIKLAPHTQQVVCSSNWSRPYSREEAAFPAKFVKPETKLWPTVGRVDDTFGDTNLFCSCPPVAADEQPA